MAIAEGRGHKAKVKVYKRRDDRDGKQRTAGLVYGRQTLPESLYGWTGERELRHGADCCKEVGRPGAGL